MIRTACRPAHLTLIPAILLMGCSVDQVNVRLNPDLSGQFTTILAVDRQIEQCTPLASALQELLADTVAGDSQLGNVLQYGPFNDGALGGVRAFFAFESPDEIPLRIGQLQRVEFGEIDNEELAELLDQIDSLPVSFESRIAPPAVVDGETQWEAEFRGDPSVLATFNLPDGPQCTRADITFSVTMPDSVSDFSPRDGRAEGVQVDANTVRWNIPREGGEVVLTVRAGSASATEETIEDPVEPRAFPSPWVLGFMGIGVVAGLIAFRVFARRGGSGSRPVPVPARPQPADLSALKYMFSYSRADSEFVLKLAQDLREAGVATWLDQLDIPAGAHWDTEVENALRDCQAMIIVLSPRSVASQQVLDEVTFAIEEHRPIIPVLYEPCEIPLRLRRMNYIDFTSGFEPGLERLLQMLGNR